MTFSPLCGVEPRQEGGGVEPPACYHLVKKRVGYSVAFVAWSNVSFWCLVTVMDLDEAEILSPWPIPCLVLRFCGCAVGLGISFPALHSDEAGGNQLRLNASQNTHPPPGLAGKVEAYCGYSTRFM